MIAIVATKGLGYTSVGANTELLMMIRSPIDTVMGARKARSSCLYSRYKATPHSMGDAQTSCRVTKLRQMRSVSVDMSVTATVMDVNGRADYRGCINLSYLIHPRQ
jgi:hypothetical protein